MKTYLKVLFIAVLFILILTLPLTAQDDFSSFMTDEYITELQWSGSGSLISRYSSEYNNILNSKIDVYPQINLDLDYIGDKSEFRGKIVFSGYSNLNNHTDLNILLSQIIDEAYIRLFFNKFDIEAGYMKIIWGKGDNFFTFDNLNTTDYTDFINQEYLDRKVPDAMIKFNIPFGMQGMVEAVYTPVFSNNIYPTDSTWSQNIYQSTEISSTASNSQLGIRITNSPGGLDLGTSYQFTFIREPFTETGFETLSMDRAHILGLETAFVILGFNIRSEAAYYLTNDIKGDDPLVHNNKALFLLGFDRDLIIHNLSINIQSLGEIKIGANNIEFSDIEYTSDEKYKKYLISGGFRDSFFNERIITELTGAYYIEDKDFMIVPEIKIHLVEDTQLFIKYTFFYGDNNTLFGQFKNNDFLEIKMEYSF